MCYFMALQIAVMHSYIQHHQPECLPDRDSIILSKTSYINARMMHMIFHPPWKDHVFA